jgi:hypothetical protein
MWAARETSVPRPSRQMVSSAVVAAPTTIPQSLAIVVVVGGSPDLIEATRQAAGIAAAAKVETAELANAATVVATFRPFAIVMSEDVYAFDAAEFDALARDVNAALVKVDIHDADPNKLERILMPKLGRAHRRRQA